MIVCMRISISGGCSYKRSNHTYEYDFLFQPGDILGVFVPQTSSDSLRLALLSEVRDHPIKYYLTADNANSESQYDMIH